MPSTLDKGPGAAHPQARPETQGTSNQRITPRGFAPTQPPVGSTAKASLGRETQHPSARGGGGITFPLHWDSANAGRTEKGGAQNEGEVLSSLQTVHVGHSACPGPEASTTPSVYQRGARPGRRDPERRGPRPGISQGSNASRGKIGSHVPPGDESSPPRAGTNREGGEPARGAGGGLRAESGWPWRNPRAGGRHSGGGCHMAGYPRVPGKSD